MSKEQIALEKINEWVAKIGGWGNNTVDVLGRDDYVLWDNYLEELENILKEAGYFKKTWDDYYNELEKNKK